MVWLVVNTNDGYSEIISLKKKQILPQYRIQKVQKRIQKLSLYRTLTSDTMIFETKKKIYIYIITTGY